jgi:hypothetical protein
MLKNAGVYSENLISKTAAGVWSVVIQVKTQL